MTTTRTGYKWVGTRPVRHDGLDKVTGRARFGADYATAGMLHGAVLRSPHPHARILSIDLTEAAAMPGVKAIITGADLPDLSDEFAAGSEGGINFRDLSRNILARDKVLYEGHPVAAVAAVTLRAAQQAAEVIEVEYEILPAVLSLEHAMEDDAPVFTTTSSPLASTRNPIGPPTSPAAGSSPAATSTPGGWRQTWWWNGNTPPRRCTRAT